MTNDSTAYWPQEDDTCEEARARVERAYNRAENHPGDWAAACDAADAWDAWARRWPDEAAKESASSSAITARRRQSELKPVEDYT